LIPIDRLSEAEEIARAVMLLGQSTAANTVWCDAFSALHNVRTVHRRPIQIEQLGLT
jgi:hypothetical protein